MTSNKLEKLLHLVDWLIHWNYLILSLYILLQFWEIYYHFYVYCSNYSPCTWILYLLSISLNDKPSRAFLSRIFYPWSSNFWVCNSLVTTYWKCFKSWNSIRCDNNLIQILNTARSSGLITQGKVCKK